MNDEDDLDLPEDGEEAEVASATPAPRKVTRRKKGTPVAMGEVDDEGYYIPEDPEFTKELTETQKAKLSDRAAREVQAQLRKKAADDYLKEEIARYQALAGVGRKQLGGVLDELVSFVVNLEWEGSPYIQLDMPYGKRYYHGMRYSEPRHIYNELAYIMQAQRWQNAIFNGKNPFHEQKRLTVLNGATGAVSYQQVG